MTDIISGLGDAIRLILSLDRALWEIIILSLQVTGLALLISSAIGVPLGAGLGLWRVRGRRLITALLYTGMGLPPVVVPFAQRPARCTGLALYAQSHGRGPNDHRLSPGDRADHDGCNGR
jgi:ABC-type tungstate transport system substrate-binding protein